MKWLKDWINTTEAKWLLILLAFLSGLELAGRLFFWISG